MTHYNQTLVYPRVTVLSLPEFDVTLNYQQPKVGCLMPFLHVDVYHVAPSTVKRLLALWPHVRTALPPIIFCHGHVDDSKFHRFVTRFGWQPIATTQCTDGKTRRIYVNYL